MKSLQEKQPVFFHNNNNIGRRKKGVTHGVKEVYKTYQLIITHTLYMDSDLNNHPINTHTHAHSPENLTEDRHLKPCKQPQWGWVETN